MTNLADMPLEELWELFPIYLVPPKDAWRNQYARMERRLRTVLAPFAINRISHIGSTAIPGIMAKDIVDILIEAETSESLHAIAAALESAGFTQMSESANRISLNLGYTEDGFAEEVFHVHLRRAGDNDELYFRDYLRDNPMLARKYEQLKLGLWKRFEHDRDGYTNAKSDFIQSATAKAKAAYGNRYV